MSVEDVLEIKPLGTWSLAGSQMKAPAVARQRLACRCGWSIIGRVEDGGFLGDPSTQEFPADEQGDE